LAKAITVDPQALRCNACARRIDVPTFGFDAQADNEGGFFNAKYAK